MAQITEIQINKGQCLAHGFCEFAAPEVFKLSDESGFARLRKRAAEYYVSDAVAIRSGAEACPMDAVVVRYDDGSVIGDTDFPDAKLLAQLENRELDPEELARVVAQERRAASWRFVFLVALSGAAAFLIL